MFYLHLTEWVEGTCSAPGVAVSFVVIPDASLYLAVAWYSAASVYPKDYG